MATSVILLCRSWPGKHDVTAYSSDGICPTLSAKATNWLLTLLLSDSPTTLRKCGVTHNTEYRLYGLNAIQPDCHLYPIQRHIHTALCLASITPSLIHTLYSATSTFNYPSTHAEQWAHSCCINKRQRNLIPLWIPFDILNDQILVHGYWWELWLWTLHHFVVLWFIILPWQL